MILQDLTNEPALIIQRQGITTKTRSLRAPCCYWFLYYVCVAYMTCDTAVAASSDMGNTHGLHWLICLTNMADKHAARQLFGQNVARNCTDCKWHTHMISRMLPCTFKQHFHAFALENSPWCWGSRNTSEAGESRRWPLQFRRRSAFVAPVSKDWSQESSVLVSTKLIDSLGTHCFVFFLFQHNNQETRAWKMVRKKTH